MTSTDTLQYVKILSGPASNSLAEGIVAGFDIARSDAPGTYSETFCVKVDVSRINPVGCSGKRFLIRGTLMNWLYRGSVVDIYFDSDCRKGFFELANVSLQPPATL